MGQSVILKANRPHQRDCLHMSSDYRHTDKHLRLVMSTLPIVALGKAKPLISTAAHQKFDFDLDPDLCP